MPAKHPALRPMRRHLLKSLAAGALAGVGLSGLIRQALAAGSGPQRKQGIFRLDGMATFNGKTLKVGDAPTLPLTVITGPKTTLVFVVGADAYLMRSNSHLVLTGNTAKSSSRADSIKLLAGKLLSVFDKGERTLSTVTAVAGIRGTGIYMECDEERSYVCLCYGNILLSPADAPGAAEVIKTTHHDSPRWVYRDRITSAKVINHTDEELILLESLTGRVPPFYRSYGDEESILSDLGKTRY